MTVRESIDAAIAKVPQGNERLGTSNIPKVKQYCPDAKLVFEIGAYIGFDIPVIHKEWPDAVIHAFEPEPSAFARLDAYRSAHITVNQTALTNFCGETSFFVVHDSKLEDQSKRSEWFKTAGSLRHNGQPHYGVSPSLQEKEIKVPATTLDYYCTWRDTAIYPEVLLMDTQGSEFEILEGAKYVLPKVQAILVEWSLIEVYKGQMRLEDIQRYLAVYGFHLKHKIDLWSNHHGDAIFARE